MVTAASAAASGPSRGFQLLLLSAVLTAAVYAKSALGPLQEAMRGALTLSDTQMAVLQGPALAWPMLIVAVPLGLMVDRHSRVRLLFILGFLTLIGSLLTALAPNFASLFAARALVGLSAFAMGPTALALLADLYAPSQRGRASMAMLIGQFAGVSVAFALGGTLLTRFGSGVDAWRLAMFWLCGPLVLVTGSILALREPSRAGRRIGRSSARDSLMEFWRYRAVVVPILSGKLLAIVALQSGLMWAAPTFSRNFALSPDRVGALMAVVVPVGGILGTIVGGILADVCQRNGGPRQTISIARSLAILSAPAGLFAVMPGPLTAGAALALLIAILTAISVMAATLFLVAIPNEIRGLSIGVMTGIGVALAVGLAPLLVSGVASVIGGPAMIGKSLSIVCVSASFLCAATFAFGRRYFSPTAAQ